jgi:putative alpha-1,2-mannosidase
MASTTSSAKNASNITQGHVFPGATLPYGKYLYRYPSQVAHF